MPSSSGFIEYMALEDKRRGVMKWAGIVCRVILVAALFTALIVLQDQTGAEQSSIKTEKALTEELKGKNTDQGTENDSDIISRIDFKPDLDGFGFKNYGKSMGYEGLTPVEVKRMFGDKVCIREENGKCVLSAPGTLWMNKINEKMNGGHCFGMSTLSLLIYEKIESAAKFGGKDTNDLVIASNDPLQREIAYWFSLQFVNPTRSAVVKKPLKELINLLSESFKSKNPGDKYTLGIHHQGHGHSVTPIAIERMGDESYRMLIYDNNHPNQTRYVNVYPRNDSWYYIKNYRGNSTTILLSPLKPKLGLQECPFCDECKLKTCQARPEENSSLSANNESELRSCQIFSTGNANLLITDVRGRRLGLINGEMINEIPGADYVLPVDPVESDSSPVYYMPFETEAFNVTLNGSTLLKEDKNSLTVISPGYALDITNILMTPGEKEELKFAPPSKDKEANLFDYTSSGHKFPIIDVATMDSSNDTSYHFKVKGLVMEKGTSLALRLHQDKGYFSFYQLMPNRGNLLFERKNANPAGIYDIYLEKINESQTQIFGHTNVSIDANCIVKLNYKNWPGNNFSLPITLSCVGEDRSLNLMDMTDEMP